MTDTSKEFRKSRRFFQKREAAGEKVGGGYFVFRRGKTWGRIRAHETTFCPFEHPSAASAMTEAERLATKHPGERFVVLQQIASCVCHKTPSTPADMAPEALAALEQHQ